ncbi:MAG: amidohydrolase family protein, partial [Halobacteriales archaeon]|nr:amidohydrolase family protein [Halobacteriales archaeon]
TAEERSAIGDVAAEAGLPVVVHAWTTAEVKMAAEMGAASIEHVGAGHKPLYPEASVRVMADAGIVAVPTAQVHRVLDLTIDYPERLDDPRLREDLPDDLYGDVRESLRFFTRLDYFEGDVDDARHSREKVKQLFEGGVSLAIGTDSGTPMNFHYESTWREMDLFAEYGIPPMKVITMATRDAARLSRVGDELGTVEPGKLADLIVVDGNPLVDMRAVSPERVVHVIKGGEVIR